MVSEIWASKLDTPFKNLQKPSKNVIFFGNSRTNTARITIFLFAKPPIEIAFFESSLMGPVSGLYLKRFPRYKRLNLIMIFLHEWILKITHDTGHEKKLAVFKNEKLKKTKTYVFQKYQYGQTYVLRSFKFRSKKACNFFPYGLNFFPLLKNSKNKR